MTQVPTIFNRQAVAQRGVSSFPCLDWLGTAIPRMICPHCNSAVESSTASAKKPLVFIKVVGSDMKEYALKVPSMNIADSLAEALHAGTLVDGSQIQVHASGAIIAGGCADVHGVQTYTYSDQWLALNMEALQSLEPGCVFTIRVTPDWKGMHIVYYHFDSTPSLADIEAKNAQYNPEYLENAYQAYRDSIYTKR